MVRAIGVCVALLFGVSTAGAATIQLYAPFEFSFDLDPARSIPLDGATWHIGSAAGPVASATELTDALSTLTGLTIGATGQGTVLGPGITGAFGFAFTNPNLGGIVSNDFATCCSFDGWGSTGPGGIGSWSSTGGAPGGELGLISFNTDAPVFIGLVAPPGYSGDLSAAFGNTLSFRFSALHAGFGPDPYYDFGSGVAILSATVPEPGTLAFLTVGIGVRLAIRRRRKAGTLRAG